MIKIKTILHYGGVCPFQLDALTNDDRMIYGRYRWGRLTVNIGEIGDHSEFAAVLKDNIYDCQIGDSYDGRMELEEFKFFTSSVLDWSEAFDQHTVEREALLNKLRSK